MCPRDLFRAASRALFRLVQHLCHGAEMAFESDAVPASSIADDGGIVSIVIRDIRTVVLSAKPTCTPLCSRCRRRRFLPQAGETRAPLDTKRGIMAVTMRTSNRWLSLLGVAVIMAASGVVAYSDDDGSCYDDYFADGDCDDRNNRADCGKSTCTYAHLCAFPPTAQGMCDEIALTCCVHVSPFLFTPTCPSHGPFSNGDLS